MKGTNHHFQQILIGLKKRSEETKANKDQQDYSDVCPKCKGTHWIITDHEKWLAAPCDCMEDLKFRNRFKRARIPERMKHATFETFKTDEKLQENMLRVAKEYVRDFDQIKNHKPNGFAFIACMGEYTMDHVKDYDERVRLRKEHNSFGLGKTHLTASMCKELVSEGYRARMISDVSEMNDLTNAKRINDAGEDYYKKVDAIVNSDVVFWDDLGKSNPTESKRQIYYEIIDLLWSHDTPLVFSTNEDFMSLEEKIGGSITSRLHEMIGDRMYEVEGKDYRKRSTKL